MRRTLTKAFHKATRSGAKAPQNMMHKEQNKIKNTILFQNYHPFKNF